jgi:hypothetical protein
VNKTSQLWVATLVRTISGQPDTAEVHAQFDRVVAALDRGSLFLPVGALRDRSPHVGGASVADIDGHSFACFAVSKGRPAD